MPGVSGFRTPGGSASGAGEHPVPVSDVPHLGRAEERRRYEAYRRRQAVRLLDLLPRDSVRPLYRRAAEETVRRTRTGAATDPLELLLDYCGRLLPLPPLEVWRADLERHLEGHLADLAQAPAPPSTDEPATLAERSLSARERIWSVSLEGFRDADAWRGRMVFRDRPESPGHPTAVVFREPDPLSLRARFRSFDEASLQAFLRSALP